MLSALLLTAVLSAPQTVCGPNGCYTVDVPATATTTGPVKVWYPGKVLVHGFTSRQAGRGLWFPGKLAVRFFATHRPVRRFLFGGCRNCGCR